MLEAVGAAALAVGQHLTVAVGIVEPDDQVAAPGVIDLHLHLVGEGALGGGDGDALRDAADVRVGIAGQV